MYDAFKTAIPEPVSILGVSLLPLSLGRYRLLHRFDSVFVAEGEAKATPAELLFAIAICSMPCSEFLDLLNYNRRVLAGYLRRWGKRIRKEINHDPHFSLFEKYALLRGYIQEASRIPKYWDETDGNAGSSAVHWSVAVEVTLRSQVGYSLDEIDEAPLSKCLLDYFKHAENQGSIRLMTEEEIAAGEANAKLFEQLQQKLEDNPNWLKRN